MLKAPAMINGLNDTIAKERSVVDQWGHYRRLLISTATRENDIVGLSVTIRHASSDSPR